jgi:PTS system galactitol-specific IIC component
VLLFADLAIIPLVLAILGPITRGNIVRIVIIGTVILAAGFYIGNAIAPLMTQAAQAAGFTLPENAAAAAFIVSIGDGFLWLPLLFLVLGRSLGWIGVLIMVVLLAAVWYFYSRRNQAWEQAAGGPSREELASAD